MTRSAAAERWDARWAAAVPDFEPHPILGMLPPLPPGPVLELACGPSGAALALAAQGRRVLAVDVSPVALRQLAEEAARRGLSALVETAEADLEAGGSWPTLPREPDCRFALVLATRYYFRPVLRSAAALVAPGGCLAWEAFDGRAVDKPQDWRLADDEPESLLGKDFETVLRTPLDLAEGPFRRSVHRRRR